LIGISFYLNDTFAEDRIRFAAGKGVKRAFTSLHIPEESGDLANQAKHLLHIAKENGIEVYADVSAKTPSHLGVENLFALKSLGVIGLRLDDYFKEKIILRLAKDYKIALNASILLENEVERLITSGLNVEQIIAWHNFYPRQETGLDETFFQTQNELFKKNRIPVCAYIPGDLEKRGPLFKGLPTMEKHREMDPLLAALELKQSGVEDIYIGDPGISEELIDRLIEIERNIVTLRTEGFQEGVYQLRPDFSRDVLRLMDTRSSDSVIPENTLPRPVGTVTRDNDLYGRYRGEVQITRHDLSADERVNVIGRINPEDIPLLSLLKPGQKIKLIHS
jgi:uncharacterized protein